MKTTTGLTWKKDLLTGTAYAQCNRCGHPMSLDEKTSRWRHDKKQSRLTNKCSNTVAKRGSKPRWKHTTAEDAREAKKWQTMFSRGRKKMKKMAHIADLRQKREWKKCGTDARPRGRPAKNQKSVTQTPVMHSLAKPARVPGGKPARQESVRKNSSKTEDESASHLSYEDYYFKRLSLQILKMQT